MGITAIQKIVDVTYQVYFTEPLFEVFGDKNRQKLVMHLLKSYELKLNDIKFNSDFPSDNLIHISKFYGQTFFNTHLGLEQIELRVSRIQSEKQLETLFVGIVPLVAKEFISRQRFSINQHLKIDKVNNYLNSLNPHSPSKLKDLIDSNGVFYKLSIPEHKMIANVTLIISLIDSDMLFYSFESDFSNNLYDFDTAFKIAREYYDIVTDGVNLDLQNEE